MLQRVKKLEERMRNTCAAPAGELSQEDQDCLDIVEIAMKVNGAANPNYHDIEATLAWKRGWEIHQRLYPITPVHLDPLFGKLDKCQAFYSFAAVHGRDPLEGDVLAYEDVVRVFTNEVHSCLYNQLLHDAWERQIKNLPYPLKSLNGLLYLRTSDPRTGDVKWEEHHDFVQDHPQYRWRRVEEDLGRDKTVLARVHLPITPVVVFCIDSEGEYSVKSYTAAGRDQ